MPICRHTELRKDGYVSNTAWIESLTWPHMASFLASERRVWRRSDGEIAGYWKSYANLEQVG